VGEGVTSCDLCGSPGASAIEGPGKGRCSIRPECSSPAEAQQEQGQASVVSVSTALMTHQPIHLYHDITITIIGDCARTGANPDQSVSPSCVLSVDTAAVRKAARDTPTLGQAGIMLSIAQLTTTLPPMTPPPPASQGDAPPAVDDDERAGQGPWAMTLVIRDDDLATAIEAALVEGAKGLAGELSAALRLGGLGGSGGVAAAKGAEPPLRVELDLFWDPAKKIYIPPYGSSAFAGAAAGLVGAGAGAGTAKGLGLELGQAAILVRDTGSSQDTHAGTGEGEGGGEGQGIVTHLARGREYRVRRP
jgi:hypothetical protein